MGIAVAAHRCTGVRISTLAPQRRATAGARSLRSSEECAAGPYSLYPKKNRPIRRRRRRLPRHHLRLRRLTCPYDAMSAVFCNREYCLHIVVLGQPYGALYAAPLTALNNAVFARRAL